MNGFVAKLMFRFVVLFLTLIATSSVGDINVGGKVKGQVDRVSGHGNMVTQDGSSTRSSSKSSEKFRHYVSLTCKDWNRQQTIHGLKFQDEAMVGKSRDAQLLATYVNGVLDAYNSILNVSVWDKVNTWCQANPNKKIAKAFWSPKSCKTK